MWNWLQRKLGIHGLHEEIKEVESRLIERHNTIEENQNKLNSSLESIIHLLNNILDQLQTQDDNYNRYFESNEGTIKELENQLKAITALVHKKTDSNMNVLNELIDTVNIKITGVQSDYRKLIELNNSTLELMNRIETNTLEYSEHQAHVEESLVSIDKGMAILAPRRKSMDNDELKKLATTELRTIKNGRTILKFLPIRKVQHLQRRIISSESPEFLAIINAIPEMVSGGLLTDSYAFKVPKGVTKFEVMKIGEGQGTALIGPNGEIVGHGEYVKRVTEGVAVLAYGVVNLLVEQHHLSLINKQLSSLASSIVFIESLSFSDKEAEIDALIESFREWQAEFPNNIKDDKIQISVLTNIISANKEIKGLIAFYFKVINRIDSKKEMQNIDLDYLRTLQELFLIGKILESAYKNRFDNYSISNIIDESNEVKERFHEIYTQLIDKQTQYGLKDLKSRWFDWIVGKMNKKKQQREVIQNDAKHLIECLLEDSDARFSESKQLLQKLKEINMRDSVVVIEDGNVYEVTENIQEPNSLN